MAWLMMEQEMVDTELAIKTCLKVCTVVERESPGPWILDPEEESWNFSVHLFFYITVIRADVRMSQQ
jgi:hypothetical protein